MGKHWLPRQFHDSVILQSAQLWTDITEYNLIPSIGKDIEEVVVSPLILGDSAFPFCSLLIKPYGHAIRSAKESYFSYRLACLSRNFSFLPIFPAL